MTTRVIWEYKNCEGSKMKNILRLFCVAFFVVIVGVSYQYVDVEASQAEDAIQEQKDGLSTAPNNLGLGSGLSTSGSSNPSNELFVAGDFSGYTGKPTNWALLLDSRATTFSSQMRAIRMTFSKNQAGAIWSNVDQGNYIDISKKQTLSMWLYFGPTQHLNYGDGFGDGMAFVMQNPNNGITAFSSKNNTLAVGESLGVWGADNDGNVSTTSSIAKTAISNSWALEFDTYNNVSTSSGSSSSFDIGLPDQHIGYGYPADPATYKQNGSKGLFSNNYYYSQNLSGVEHTTLHDGKCHHLTISWDPSTNKATYSFNDKNPDDDSKGSNPITRTTEVIKKAEFGNLTSNKLQWGFTATTGANYEPNLIAFESIPSSVEASNSSTITDITQNKEFGSNGTVNSNDKLSINYRLAYSSGKDFWSNINAKLKLPDNVTYTPDANGNIGYIRYNDGSDPEAIPASELSGTTVTHLLKKSLSDTSKSNINNATISINGTVNSVNSDTTVASKRAVIDSDNLITDIDTPSFTIKKSKPINLTLDQSNVTVGPNTGVTITGTVFYTDGTPITNSLMSVFTKLNGETFRNFVMTDSEPSGHLTFTIPADKLTQDTNTLEVYVGDPAANMTPTSKVIIAKKGALSLTVNKAYEFGSINDSSASRLISRKGNWDIMVNDGREAGPDSTWNLSASTSDLTSDTNKFNGNMVFRNSNGVESILTGNNLVNIANGVKNQTGQQTTNIASNWDDSDGIFLRSNGLTTAGNYSGEINWTLADTV